MRRLWVFVSTRLGTSACMECMKAAPARPKAPLEPPLGSRPAQVEETQ